MQTVDMGNMGPMGGVPVASPAAGIPASASSTMLSPGSHSPGPQSNIVPSPAAYQSANVPSPGMALNTPGRSLSVSCVVCVCRHTPCMVASNCVSRRL